MSDLVVVVVTVVLWALSTVLGWRPQKRMDRYDRALWWVITLGFWPCAVAIALGWQMPGRAVTAGFIVLLVAVAVSLVRGAREMAAIKRTYDEAIADLARRRADDDDDSRPASPGFGPGSCWNGSPDGDDDETTGTP